MGEWLNHIFWGGLAFYLGIACYYKGLLVGMGERSDLRAAWRAMAWPVYRRRWIEQLRDMWRADVKRRRINELVTGQQERTDAE